MDSPSANCVHDSVRQYYTDLNKGVTAIKSNVCGIECRPSTGIIQEAMELIHPTISSKYYGCGLVIPSCLDGCSVLDQGCGAGRDCFILSKLVGENGQVVGVDMTKEQLDLAQKYISYHTEKFGYKKDNVKFIDGFIENLSACGISDESFDIIVSNCVVNLSPDKKAVLSSAFQALKLGGEVYFSDIYADRKFPEELRKHEILWGECISGALWWEEFCGLAREIGFATPRVVSASKLQVKDKNLEELLGDIRVLSVTCRLFKNPCQVKMTEVPEKSFMCTYQGNVVGYPKELKLDCKATLQKDEPQLLDEQLALFLRNSRYQHHLSWTASDEPAPKGCQIDPFKFNLEEFTKSSQQSGKCC